MKLRTCVEPEGRFRWGVHRPQFKVANFRKGDEIGALGTTEDGCDYQNLANFPQRAVEELDADWIFEIPNAFPFRGVTYICKSWADEKAVNPAAIRLPGKTDISLNRTVAQWSDDGKNEYSLQHIVDTLPDSLRIALASTSTDPKDLICLAGCCCEFVYNKAGDRPIGLKYRSNENNGFSACISDHDLFETLVNNSHLPDPYKEVMVLRPGVQGKSEIVGDWHNDEGSHVYEYLRRNSYIPWGHYAANMANDSVRYAVNELSLQDITGLRHLYYQRTYTRIAQQCGIAIPRERQGLSTNELDTLRERILEHLSAADPDERMEFNQTLWGWNFGFDFAPSHYRLHASHQQIHQQFALIPAFVSVETGHTQGRDAVMPAYGCGNMIADFTDSFRTQTGKLFYKSYIHAIRSNRRMDGIENGQSSLIVYEDGEVMLFVPKAQTSQWELQLLTIKPVGNILEAGFASRQSLDRAMLIAAGVLSGMGARMITTIEYPKPFDSEDSDQRLLYSFLPKLPESPGAFSEAQLRWINGHYPEDFAAACRLQLSSLNLEKE